MNGRRRVHLRISGMVQGVSFRYYARQQAQRLGVGGWVRNCPDGTVEAEAEGDEDAVRAFIDWAHHGPSGASVEHVRVDWEEPSGEGGPFRIRG